MASSKGMFAAGLFAPGLFAPGLFRGEGPEAAPHVGAIHTLPYRTDVFTLPARSTFHLIRPREDFDHLAGRNEP